MISIQASPVEHLQTVEEFDKLIKDYYIPAKPEIVVEIGSFYGATLWSWIQNNPNLKTLISIDLPIEQDDYRYNQMLESRAKWNDWTKGIKFHDIKKNSQSISTLTKTYALTSGKVDFLFIDGDHSYEGVRSDWEMYKETVRPGGLIVFHDTFGYDSVKKLIQEIEALGYDVKHINENGGWGISIVKL